MGQVAAGLGDDGFMKESLPRRKGIMINNAIPGERGQEKGEKEANKGEEAGRSTGVLNTKPKGDGFAGVWAYINQAPCPSDSYKVSETLGGRLTQEDRCLWVSPGSGG